MGFTELQLVFNMADGQGRAPTAGGQYHWASEFAPASIQKLVSYIAGTDNELWIFRTLCSPRLTGWLASVAWLAGLAGGVFISGLTYQGEIVANNLSYIPQPYQAWLLGVMIITVGVLINTVLARWLPRLEGIIFILFVLAFLTVMVVLWVLAPRLTSCMRFLQHTLALTKSGADNHDSGSIFKH